MIEVQQFDTHTLVQDELVSAVFGGVKLGNVDPRFSSLESIEQNRLAAFAFLTGEKAVSTSGLVVMEPTGHQSFTDLSHESELKVDGLITTETSVVLSGNPADCEMIGMYGRGARGSVLGLIHVSRGIAEANGHGIALEYINNTYGLTPEQTRLIFAPSIRRDSYKFPSINPAQKEDEKWAPYIEQDEQGYWHVDTHGRIVSELLNQGVVMENIYDSAIDVGAGADYFSHRQFSDSGQTRGRNAVMIRLNPVD